jgi:TonB family protein
MNQHDQNSEPQAISSDESPKWLEGFTHWLIHRAARGAPPALSERLEEEWLADLASRRSALLRLRFGLGCCWATRVIAHEHCTSRVAVTNSALGAFLHDESGGFSRRSITLILVVGLHIALFYGLMTGLSGNIKKLIPSPFVTRILHEPQPQSVPPSIPRPPLTTQKIEAPIPEFPSAREPDDNEDVIPTPVSNPPGSAPSAPPHVANRVPGGPGIGFPNAEDFYPSAAKRMEEQGVATVRVCVDANGRLTSEPSTLQSSGSSRLDEGALQLAKAGSGHYRASTEDGRPVNSCYAFRVRFQLRN